MSGFQAIAAPGQPFHDPDAARALFAALEERFKPSATRRLLRLPYHINEPSFATALVDHFLEIVNNEPFSKTRVA